MTGWRENLMGFALVVCAALIASSFFLGLVLSYSGMRVDYAAVTLVVVGLCSLIMIGCFVYGISRDRNPSRGVEKTRHYAYVVARSAMERGRPLAEWEIGDAENARFYVRLRFPEGDEEEFETVEPVYFNSGEGMTGEAVVRGRWLGRYRPYIGYNPTRGDQYPPA